uniref:myotubularin-related protein 8-like isoform X2 n=1 Tax=Ciona intestinalis TaxID=7719 RepID=UPI000EF48789|nr:myotubularin-related protein 8-like isoform X2 [Ciona intestinalis]|eukprot:XP_026693368.1 myotubularin-related protein 8-like isoform X2 [Ciona intestinalis]
MEFIKTPKVENVRLIEQNTRNSVEGTLYLTASHLIFIDTASKHETWLVHTHIQYIDKPSIVQGGSALKLRCKTFQVLIFLISQERDCHDLYSSLLKLSKPETLEDLYAFSYNPRAENLKQQEGWDLFSLNNDFLQMGLPTRYWKISRINNEFGLCDTYPKLVCVPSLATPALMMGSAAFRSKRRLPVMSYLHKNDAVIVRCSQPMAGLNSRSIEDEAYVDLIRRSKTKSSDFMYIVDTRPMINAVANRAQGKGYENTDVYENIKYLFLGIDNIHVMRASLNKLLEACEDTTCSMSTWLEAVNSSGWLRHVHNVLQVSRFIAQAVGVEGRSVLVHCSDGWDRTAQTCALSSIMLNAHYRTIDGFLALIQKEWLHFGHKFTHRCGHIDGDGRETSPVFTQFIDAVWQLMRIFPCDFQFNETLLFDLHDHVYSCQFGTFLGNCAKERQEYSLAARTYSLWGWMMKRTNTYINPLYKAAMQNTQDDHLLLPPTTPHFVRFWVKMYNRHNRGLLPRQNPMHSVANFKNKTDELKNKVLELKRQKRQLETQLGIVSDPTPMELVKASTPQMHQHLIPSPLKDEERTTSQPDLIQLKDPQPTIMNHTPQPEPPKREPSPTKPTQPIQPSTDLAVVFTAGESPDELEHSLAVLIVDEVKHGDLISDATKLAE